MHWYCHTDLGIWRSGFGSKRPIPSRNDMWNRYFAPCTPGKPSFTSTFIFSHTTESSKLQSAIVTPTPNKLSHPIPLTTNRAEIFNSQGQNGIKSLESLTWCWLAAGTQEWERCWSASRFRCQYIISTIKPVVQSQVLQVYALWTHIEASAVKYKYLAQTKGMVQGHEMEKTNTSQCWGIAYWISCHAGVGIICHCRKTI